MIYDLSKSNSLVNQFIAELRDVTIQEDRLRFRKNLERLGEIFAYEISKKLSWENKEINTSLGISKCSVLKEQPILATILRAGIPFHQGLLNYFDKADNGFISAYRKHSKDGSFNIEIEYLSCPSINDKTLIIADPMLATGASLVLTLQQLLGQGKPKDIHIVTIISCTEGIEYVQKNIENFHLWTAAIDDELTGKGYIVPGLGDAGDLAYGKK